MVWDAAAKVDGVSLNDVLLKGPDQLQSLPKILYGFRIGRIAVCADIREMFHQVRIREDDQHSQRFLWRDGDGNRKPEIYVMQAMTFGATCSPCSAQYVKNVNAVQYIEEFPRAVEAILDHHYMEDLLDSVETAEEAIQLSKESIYVYGRAGFEIRHFMSNSTEALEALNVNSVAQKKFKSDSLSSEKVSQVAMVV